MIESVGVEDETDALKNPVICAPLCAGDESVGVEDETDSLKNPVICAPLCAGDESVGVEDKTDALKNPVTDVLRCVQVRLKHQSHSHGVPAL